jgi:hypothetical protein
MPIAPSDGFPSPDEVQSRFQRFMAAIEAA